MQWTPSDAVHPFWFIKRTEKDENEANSDLVLQEVTQVSACSLKSLSSEGAELAPFAETFSVSVPCIVNTLPIEMDKEVILKGKPKPKDKRKSGSAGSTEETAFDQLVVNDRKQRRVKAKAKAA